MLCVCWACHTSEIIECIHQNKFCIASVTYSFLPLQNKINIWYHQMRFLSKSICVFFRKVIYLVANHRCKTLLFLGKSITMWTVPIDAVPNKFDFLGSASNLFVAQKPCIKQHSPFFIFALSEPTLHLLFSFQLILRVALMKPFWLSQLWVTIEFDFKHSNLYQIRRNHFEQRCALVIFQTIYLLLVVGHPL